MPSDEGTGLRVTRHACGRLPGDGVELAYGFWPGRGEPIVAVHALTASYMTFVGIGDRLAGRRPLLALDLRGRGDSDKPAGPYGMRQHAADVAAAMRAFGLGPSVVVGHSMGAYVATVLAVEHPDLVAGLVLLDGGHPPELPEGLDSDALLDRILGPVIERLHREFPSTEAYLDSWRRLPIFADVPGHSAWGPWVEAYLTYDLAGEDTGPLRPKALEAAVRADFADMGRRDEVERRLKAVRAPVLVIRAECGLAPDQPGVLGDSHMERIRVCVPNVVEHTLADTTHYTVALAEPGASTVAGLVVDFAEECGV